MGLFSSGPKVQLYGVLQIDTKTIACPKCGDAGTPQRGFQLSSARSTKPAWITCTNRHSFHHPAILGGLVASLAGADGSFTVNAGRTAISSSTTPQGALAPSAGRPGPGNRGLAPGTGRPAASPGLATVTAALNVVGAAVTTVGTVAGAAGNIAKAGSGLGREGIGLLRDGVGVGDRALKSRTDRRSDERKYGEAAAVREDKAAREQRRREDLAAARAARAALPPRRSKPAGSKAKPAPKTPGDTPPRTI